MRYYFEYLLHGKKNCGICTSNRNNEHTAEQKKYVNKMVNCS